ncbi:MAG: hypothetical protein AAGU15_09355 [Anaerolineaceae bacterium]
MARPTLVSLVCVACPGKGQPSKPSVDINKTCFSCGFPPVAYSAEVLRHTGESQVAATRGDLAVKSLAR